MAANTRRWANCGNRPCANGFSGMVGRASESGVVMAIALMVLGLLVGLSSAAPSAHAAATTGAAFDRLWADTKVTLGAGTSARAKPEQEKKRIETRRAKRKGSGTPPELKKGPDARASQAGVCRSQCNLERQTCDGGRNGFQNRSDQIQAAQQSCFLAGQSCLQRC